MSIRADKLAGWVRLSIPKRALSHLPLGGATALPGTKGWGSGARGDLRTLGAAVSLSLSHPWRLQPRVYPLGIPRLLEQTQPFLCWPQRNTHRPLGCGGFVGSASSRPGWDSGWRPGVGQLTSMWSRSYQNLHCSQKFHPDQGQRRWAFNRDGLSAAPRQHTG